MMKKGFTLIELAVAIGLLVIIMTVSAVIFRTGSEAMRMASANAEIMHKFQTIVSHLEADFRGIDAHVHSGLPIPIQTTQSGNNIAILAYGNFDEINYAADEMYHSNLAIICYGLTEQKFVRRQTLLTYDESYGASELFDQGSNLYKTSISELRRNSLEYDINLWTELDILVSADYNYLRQVVADNITQFEIKAIILGEGLEWIKWDELDMDEEKYSSIVALKFVFRIADSKGIIGEYNESGEMVKGRLFTHIIF